MTAPSSNPYARPTAAQMRDAAEVALTDAEIATISEGDGGREQLAAVYGYALNQARSSARNLPAEVKDQLARHMDKLQSIATAGEQLRRGIPTPRLSSEMSGPYGRQQHAYDAATTETIMGTAEQTVTQATADLDKEAQDIIRRAWAAAVPSAPDRALSGRVDAGVTAIHAAIGAGEKPAAILQRAIDAGDRELAYALLGDLRSRTLLTAIGADHLALAKQYGEHLISAGESFPGSDFLLAQQDATRSLAALRQAAVSVYRSQKERAGAVLKTRAAKASSR